MGLGMGMTNPSPNFWIGNGIKNSTSQSLGLRTGVKNTISNFWDWEREQKIDPNIWKWQMKI